MTKRMTILMYTVLWYPLPWAAHQFVIRRHQSLLVTRADKVIGIQRLEDVFTEISKAVKACQV